MPEGSTGGASGVGVGLVPEAGGGGPLETGVGGRGLVAVGNGACFERDEYSKALSDAPAAADVAATTASVVFDMSKGAKQAESRCPLQLRGY